MNDWRPIFAAVVVPSLIYAFVTCVVLAAVAGAFAEGWWTHMVQLATVIGRGVIEHLGWVFGILITIQLGCLIALLGGQINAQTRRVEATLRDALSLFSVTPVIALSPALAVAVIAAFRVGELRGSLFVMVPALALTVGLSTFIGALEKADDLTKLEMAREKEERAQVQLRGLEASQSAPFAKTVLRRSAVLILMAIAGALALCAVTVGFPWPVWVYIVYLLLIVCVIPVTVAAVSAVNAALKPALAAFEVVFSTGVLLALGALHVAGAMILLTVAWQLGIPFLVVGLVLTVDMIRALLEAREVRAGRRPRGFWRSGGALARAGTSDARKAAAKRRDGARRNITELMGKIDRPADEAPSAEGATARRWWLPGRRMR